MEIKIKCPMCSDDSRCFEDTIEDKNFKSYLCFNCGFTSNSLYIKDSDQRQLQVKNSPRLVIELEHFDEDRNIYWYPSVINMGTRGIIYPEGNEEEWSWKYAKVVDISKEDQEKYPVPGKEGDFYETRLDVESATEYGKYEFLNACKDMGIVKDEDI